MNRIAFYVGIVSDIVVLFSHEVLLGDSDLQLCILCQDLGSILIHVGGHTISEETGVWSQVQVSTGRKRCGLFAGTSSTAIFLSPCWSESFSVTVMSSNQNFVPSLIPITDVPFLYLTKWSLFSISLVYRIKYFVWVVENRFLLQYLI